MCDVDFDELQAKFERAPQQPLFRTTTAPENPKLDSRDFDELKIKRGKPAKKIFLLEKIKRFFRLKKESCFGWVNGRLYRRSLTVQRKTIDYFTDDDGRRRSQTTVTYYDPATKKRFTLVS